MRNYRRDEDNDCRKNTPKGSTTDQMRQSGLSAQRQGSGTHPISAAKRNRMKKSYDTLKDNIKRTSTHITGVPEDERGRGGKLI